MPIADVYNKARISSICFNWKRKYDGLLPTEMREACPEAQAG
jgi:hypothetical protein